MAPIQLHPVVLCQRPALRALDSAAEPRQSALEAMQPETTIAEPPAPQSAPQSEPRPRRRVGRWLALGLGGLVALGLLVELVTWPAVGALAEKNPETTAFMERYQRREGKTPAWRWVPYRAISNELKMAVLVSEDIDFFEHGGFATREIKAALEDAWEEGKPLRGASTLTQQLAKNLWLSPSRNPLRKVKEAILTVQLERKLEKHRILELYLNVAEFGPGIYGAEAAARHFFGRSAASLDRHQAAQLAAALPSPARWHPGSNSKVRIKRTAKIEGRIEKAAWLRKSL